MSPKKYKRKNTIYYVWFLAAVLMFLRFVVVPAYICQREYKEYVELYSEKYNLDKNLVYAVIKSESNFNENAVSKKGAAGLMQITENTARWAVNEIGIENFETSMIFSPEINIEIGCWYLNWLIKNFGDIETVIAAYNAGNGNVSKWLSDKEYSKDGVKISSIPYSETKSYVKKVKIYYALYKIIY